MKQMRKWYKYYSSIISQTNSNSMTKNVTKQNALELKMNVKATKRANGNKLLTNTDGDK